jgi:phospholipid/cholesterol/gamma-HCH transport system substrate-binding protein
LNGLETGLHVFPTLGANLMNIVSPVTGGIATLPVINNFANPLQFVCSAIQAGSRLGYQESAEMCAQYLAPILDAIKFNYPPFGLNMATTASTLPKMVSYSDPRLQPPGDTRTRRCPASGHATRCSRTATTSPAGSRRQACKVSTCSHSPRTC